MISKLDAINTKSR
ncbi:unnamed protein product [Callosobruchus maculatus]|uniref:Uncharacterized protein n=1 Tax=Callosobruchus maculatus TaxID=64391 RepID=A0A653BPE3_CALMS|nr:unnamed protein product [Callosobruchus maculatus]